jgi:hypothetical protein
MSGFAQAVIDDKELDKLLKKYKKIKKYMRSRLYEMRTLDGTEQIVTKLLEDTPDE